MFFLIVICWTAQDPGPSPAQDPRSDSLRSIQEALRNQDYALLESLAHKAILRNDQDPLGWFHLGYALAAQSRFRDSIGAYGMAIARGLTDPKVHYQMGYSAHRAGLPYSARGALRDCLNLQPGNVDALYYLGLTELDLDKPAEAERILTKLLEQTTRWTELARFHRGLARMKSGKRQDAQADFRWVATSGQDDALRRRSQEFLDPQDPAPAPPAAAPTSRPWSVVWYEKAGYDSNVLRLPSSSLATESSEDDVFLMSFISGSIDLAGEGRLTIRLSLFDLSYPDLKESSLDGALLTAEHETKLGARWWLEAAGEADLFLLDRESYFNQFGAKGGLRYEATERVRLRAGLSLMARDFRAEIVESLDGRDATGFLELEIKGGSGALTRLAFRYEGSDVTAETDEAAYGQHRLTVSADILVIKDWNLRLEGKATHRSFGAEDPAFGETRRDILGSLRAGIVYSVSAAIQLVLEIEVERNTSSLDAFDYDRVSFGLGMTWVF